MLEAAFALVTSCFGAALLPVASGVTLHPSPQIHPFQIGVVAFGAYSAEQKSHAAGLTLPSVEAFVRAGGGRHQVEVRLVPNAVATTYRFDVVSGALTLSTLAKLGGGADFNRTHGDVSQFELSLRPGGGVVASYGSGVVYAGAVASTRLWRNALWFSGGDATTTKGRDWLAVFLLGSQKALSAAWLLSVEVSVLRQAPVNRLDQSSTWTGVLSVALATLAGDARCR